VHVIDPERDSIGQALSNRSNDFLIRAIQGLPLIIKDHRDYTDKQSAQIIQMGKELEIMKKDFDQMARTNPNRNRVKDKIDQYQILRKPTSIMWIELERRLKILGNLQGDLQLYIYEAHKRGIQSASDLKQALETAGLFADAVRLPSFSFLSTFFAPAPSAPSDPTEIIEISSDEDEPEPFDFASADEIANQFMKDNKD
jgi:hypothetical protein